MSAAVMWLSSATSFAQEPEYEVVRDTIKYTTRKPLDTSDPMKYVVNNPATPPKGSGGLSHIHTQVADTSKIDSAAAQQTLVSEAQKQGAANENKAKPEHIYHKVRQGETLGKIASRYHVSVNSIVRLNGLKSADKISIGQKLKIK